MAAVELVAYLVGRNGLRPCCSQAGLGGVQPSTTFTRSRWNSSSVSTSASRSQLTHHDHQVALGTGKCGTGSGLTAAPAVVDTINRTSELRHHAQRSPR